MVRHYYIIGGGIIGNAIAREISVRKLGEVVVLEKESSLGMHASGRNSGVIHSGINQKSGTLKARMCVEGSRVLREYCKEHHVPMEECGTLVIARNEEQEETLSTLLEMGKKANVPDIKIISKEELAEREPCVIRERALFSPTGAIVDSLALLREVSNEARSLGVTYLTERKVIDIRNNKIITPHEEFEFDHLINCAGLNADKIAHNMGVGLQFQIIPFRGDYTQVNVPINSMVYQAPDLKYPFLGVHLTKSLDGKVLAGPNSALSFKGRESYNGKFNLNEFLETVNSPNFIRLIKSREFIKLVYRNARISLSKKAFIEEVNSLLKEEIGKENISPYRSGIRAQMVSRDGKMVNDFLIEQTENSTHILNAVSPGMTCSLAFAKYVVDNYIKG